MHDIVAFDRVVSAIYDAAIQPALWADAFAAVQGALGCDVFHSFVRDHAKERPALTWASEGVTASVERQYAQLQFFDWLADYSGTGTKLASHIPQPNKPAKNFDIGSAKRMPPANPS